MIIGITTAFVLSAVLAYVLGFKDPIEEEAEASGAKEPAKDQGQGGASDKPGDLVHSPISGTAVPLSEVPDPAFAAEAMGKGIAIEPAEGRVVAPFDGTITVAFKKKHALSVVSDNGAEILIHVGIDTVKLGGQYFTSHIKEGDRVSKGQLLLEFDVDKIRAAGFPTVTPVIVTNTFDYSDVLPLQQGEVHEGEELLRIVGSEDKA